MKQNLFNTVRLKAPKRNFFDMSYDRKFSLDAGKLVPVHVQEIIPGDKIDMTSMQMIRLAPMVAPVMHEVNVFVHHFFVPNRLVWSNWEDFITGGDGIATPPVFPTVNFQAADVQPGTIPDYLGFPCAAAPMTSVSAMTIAMYALIYNEYYRDQNLQTPLLSAELVDGDNSAVIQGEGLYGQPLRRAWEHDYFTAALPFAQKGAAATLPLGTTARILYDNPGNLITQLLDPITGNPAVQPADLTTGTTGTETVFDVTDFLGNHSNMNVDNSNQLKADLSTATSSTINDLRRAFKLQEWLEKNARGGTRYIESILSHFGVRSSDSRLQRPEYLGGGKSSITISEVLQTSESINTPQGNLSGHGINVGRSNQFSRSFEEHGYVISIMSVMPKPCYQDGIPRTYLKLDKLDYFWPSFAHIGEQEIQNKELFVAGTVQDDATFGYIPRYSEYRYLPSSVHGDFRDTLQYWHWGRSFGTAPALNSAFIECDPGKRIFAVQDIPDDGTSPTPIRQWNTMYCHMFHQIKAFRPIPKYGEPTL